MLAFGPAGEIYRARRGLSNGFLGGHNGIQAASPQRVSTRRRLHLSVCAASFRIAAMNFPPFWAKASHAGFSCWRWSHQSLSEAQNLAEEAARKLAAQFSSGARQRHRYAYADRPLREAAGCKAL